MTSDEELQDSFAEFIDQLALVSPVLAGLARRMIGADLLTVLRTAVDAAERTLDVGAGLRAAYGKLDEVWTAMARDVLGFDEATLALTTGTGFDPTRALFDAIASGSVDAMREAVEWAKLFDEATDTFLPKNWGTEIRFGDVFTLTLVYGIPLIDHPPAEVVGALADAVRTDASPYAVFETHRSEILDDLALLALPLPGDEKSVAEHAAHLAEIVEALRHGLDRVAQRSAASLIDVIARAIVLVPGSTAGSRALIASHADDAIIVESPWIELRDRSALHCAMLTLAEFWPDNGHPIPPGLNRHASVHTASAVQHTPKNAVWAALIVGNLLALERRHPGSEIDELRKRLLGPDEGAPAIEGSNPGPAA